MKVKNDITICAYGTDALLQQVKILKKEWEGVRAARKDIEYVHRMRVATRRFRSIFDIFKSCFPKKKRGQWEAEIIRLTKALSKARDLDVHIVMLTNFSQTLQKPQHHAGIKRLQLRLRQERSRVQPQLINDLDRIQKKNVLEDIETSLKKKLPEATDTPSRYDPRLYQMAFKSINRCMNRLLSYDGRIQNPSNVKDLHDMRLEAKNLRYTIEIFRDLYTDQLATQLAVVQEIQGQLGIIHDDDIWLIDLEKFHKTERKRTKEFYGHEGPFNLLVPGLSALSKDRKANREAQYKDFIHKWEKWKEENLWGSLYQATKLPTIIYQPEPEIEEQIDTTQEPVAKGPVSEKYSPPETVSSEALPMEEKKTSVATAKQTDKPERGLANETHSQATEHSSTNNAAPPAEKTTP